MGIRVRSGKIEFSSRVEWQDLYSWALSNNTYASVLDESIIELKYPAKIKNNSILDTSYNTLILSHRLEGNSTTSTNISGQWLCNKGVVRFKGSNNMYSEYWAPMIWNDVHVVFDKTGGMLSFFRSEAASSAVISTIRNCKYFIKQGQVDAHLQLEAGKGIISNTQITSEDSRGGFLLIRDTDTDGLVIKGLNLGGWSNLNKPVTFHKNMTMDHGTGAAKDRITIYYRRNNYPVFYNVMNETTQTRKKEIHYENPSAWSGPGRAILVGKFSPTFIDSSDTPVEGANINIVKVNDGSVEHEKVTTADGVVDIRNNNSNALYKSLSWHTRDIYELGACYIKQAITPNANGPQQSEDQGQFEVNVRKADLVPFRVTADFHVDIEGDIVMFADENYKFSFNNYNQYRQVDTAQELYDHYKQHISELANLRQDNVLTISGNTIISDYSITVDGSLYEGIVIDNDNALIRVGSTNFVGNFHSNEGMVRLVNDAKVEGTIEDINGCRVRIFAKQGGNFNIVAKRADNDFLLADYSGVDSVDVYIPRGIDIKFAMWQAGYQVFADTIKTDNGGVNYYAPMVKNPYINTKLDVMPYLANIRVGLDYPTFTMYVDSPMVLDIEQIKLILHYIVGSSESLTTSMNTGSTVSTIEILKDEVKINLPFVVVRRGGALNPQDRVEFNGYINTESAKLINPNYIVNPSEEDGLFVQVLAVKPTLDPALLAQVVKDNLRPDLATIRGQVISAINGN